MLFWGHVPDILTASKRTVYGCGVQIIEARGGRRSRRYTERKVFVVRDQVRESFMELRR